MHEARSARNEPRSLAGFELSAPGLYRPAGSNSHANPSLSTGWTERATVVVTAAAASRRSALDYAKRNDGPFDQRRARTSLNRADADRRQCCGFESGVVASPPNFGLPIGSPLDDGFVVVQSFVVEWSPPKDTKENRTRDMERF